jgi:hypothetical protein
MSNHENYPYHVRDLNISDPCILVDPASRKYYTYAHFTDFERFPVVKSAAPRFFAYESEDLIHWSEPKICFEKTADFWADLDYWAPEVHLYKGKYYLISSFRTKGSYRRCQALVSDSPLGPFAPIKPGPVTPKGWHCLDGTLYLDRKEKPWMVFCHEWLQVNDGQIAAVPLSDDLGEAVGEPLILFYASEGPWASKLMGGVTGVGNGFVTDGCYLHRMKNGTLIMLWSSFAANGGYTTGYARSVRGDIQGPWVQEPLPLYGMDGAHSMLFYTFEGQLMMSLHCPNDHKRKRILLFEMAEEGDKLRIINEVTGNWYNAISGLAGRYAYAYPCEEELYFTEKYIRIWKGR